MNAVIKQPPPIAPAKKNGPHIRKNVYGLYQLFWDNPTAALTAGLGFESGDQLDTAPDNFIIYDFINGRLIRRIISRPDIAYINLSFVLDMN